MSDYLQQLIDDMRAQDGQVTTGWFKGRPMIILTTTGAKSGKRRTTPLALSRDGDRYVIVASKSGAPTHPAWYHNLVANRYVTVEVNGETFVAKATVVDDPVERRRLYDQHDATHEGIGFKGYEGKTTRVIPVVVLEREAPGRS
jgi:deazaflavin-dependent oxidoreductase (nitroreductase family)